MKSLSLSSSVSFSGRRSQKPTRTNALLSQARNTEDGGNGMNIDDSYVSNSHKENLCLEYVDEFLGNFLELFPGRR